MLHPDTVAMNDRWELLKECNVPLDLSILGRHSDTYIGDMEEYNEEELAIHTECFTHLCFDCGKIISIAEREDTESDLQIVGICLYCRSPICDECYGNNHSGGIECRGYGGRWKRLGHYLCREK